MRHLAKLGLPIVVAIIIVIGTIGITVAGFVTNRDVNILTLTPISVLPDTEQAIVVYRGGTNYVEYTCTNDSDKDVNVAVSTSVLPEGLTVVISPETFPLAKGDVQTVMLTFDAAGDMPSDNNTVSVHFSVV